MATLLDRFLSLFTRKTTIPPRPYVGPGIEVLVNGAPIGAVVTDLTNYAGRTRETNLNARPAPGSDTMQYKWSWVVAPPKGVYLKFDNSSYTILIVEPTAELGTGKLQVVGTRADGTQEFSKLISIPVIRSVPMNTGA